MTVTSGLRHSACKHCRDRKVRCDGQQPACEKCRRAGEECVYLPTQRPTRADLTHTVEALQKRLNEAEARIARMVRQTNQNSISAAARPSQNTGSSWLSTDAVDTEMGETIFRHIPTFPDPCSISHEPGSQPMVYPTPLSGDFLDLLQPARYTNVESIDVVNDDENRDSDPLSVNSNLASFRQASHGSSPSSADTNALSSPFNSSIVPTGHNDAHIQLSADLNAAIAAHITAFTSSVLQSQAEIAGLALAVSKYIAWMRKIPSVNSPPNTTTVNTNMLEAVETRLHEMREIAQTRPAGAFHEMVMALKALDPTGGSNLESLEEEFRRRAVEVEEFFETRYNACALLKEQAGNVPNSCVGNGIDPPSQLTASL